MIHDLNAEWSYLSDSPETLAAIAQWRQACPALAQVSTGQELLATVVQAPDDILGFLIARHHEGCKLAGRIVLQTMLGKLVLMAQPTSRRADLLEEMVSQLWVCIAQYPLDRRPRSVAANLAFDARKRARASLDTDEREISTDPLVLADIIPQDRARDLLRAERAAYAHQAAELLDRALAARIISQPAHALMVTIYREDHTTAEAACIHGMSYGAVRTSTWSSRRRIQQALPRLAVA